MSDFPIETKIRHYDTSWQVEVKHGGNWYLHEGFDSLENAQNHASWLKESEGGPIRIVKVIEIQNDITIKSLVE